jgi:hypothetical protein
LVRQTNISQYHDLRDQADGCNSSNPAKAQHQGSYQVELVVYGVVFSLATNAAAPERGIGQ